MKPTPVDVNDRSATPDDAMAAPDHTGGIDE